METYKGYRKLGKKSKSPNLRRHIEKQVPLAAKHRANIPFLPAFTIIHLKILQNNNIPALFALPGNQKLQAVEDGMEKRKKKTCYRKDWAN